MAKETKTEFEIKTDLKEKTESETREDLKEKTESETNTDLKDDAESEIHTDLNEYAESELNTETEFRSEQETAAERKMDSETAAERKMEPVTGSEINFQAALEAILFALGEPVTLQTIARALDTDVSTALDEVMRLQEACESADRGVRLIELEGSYQLCTKPEYYRQLITIASVPEKPVLTDTVLETLAIIAYRQPVTKAEINRIRGVSSDHAVSKLVEYGLIREAGRLNAPGRPILFVTTKEFLRRFGMDSLEQLPETAKNEENE